MKLFYLLLLLSASSCLATDTVQEEDGVLVLDVDNFQSAVDSNELLLVEFYAPWCGHCKKLAPEYAEAAASLAGKESKAKLAKVDATENKELAKEYGVKGYPTLKWFKNGEASDYGGGRTAGEIVSWVEKKSGPPAVAVSSAEEAEAFVKGKKVAVIGFFKDAEGEEAQAFKKVADAIESAQFAITSEDSVYKEFGVTAEKSVVLLKKFDEGRNVHEDDFTVEAVTKFVNGNSMPLVVDLNQNTAKQIFGGSIHKYFVYFASAQSDDFEYKVNDLRKVAKDHKGDMLFVTVTTDEADQKRVIDFFGVSMDEVPTFRIADMQDDLIKYRPADKEMTMDNVRSFIKEFQSGSLQPHYKSEELAEDWDAGPVKVLVGSNFEQVAMDTTKDVFVEFYAPWCGHCKKLAPIWDELGDRFKDSDRVVIAKLDATANEVSAVKVRGFPTLKLFRAETNEVVDYSGDRNLESFVKFLEPDTDQEEEGAAKDEL